MYIANPWPLVGVKLKLTPNLLWWEMWEIMFKSKRLSKCITFFLSLKPCNFGSSAFVQGWLIYGQRESEIDTLRCHSWPKIQGGSNMMGLICV